MRKLLFILFGLAYLNANDIDVTQPLRIQELMPRDNLFCSLAVEPALPKDFVALAENGEISYSSGVYWGPEKTLKAYFKDPKSLDTPILKVAISSILFQDCPEFFNEKSIREDVKSNPEFKDISVSFGNWGIYRYFRASGKLQNTEVNIAHVGLNDPSGAVLTIDLVIPNTKNGKSDALKLWNDFFKNTTMLPEPLFYKAQGQELHIGRTIVDIVGRKIKVIAEKRKSDKKMRFTIVPPDENIEFKFENAKEVKMEGNWNFGKPLLKVKGQYIIDKGWVQYNMVTSIFIKDVDEFSKVNSTNKNVFTKDL